MSSKSLDAIKLIQESNTIEMPAGQMEMPRYYSTRSTILKEAIELLEDEIKGFEIAAKGFNMNEEMTWSLYNSNSEGGKRCKRKTRKARKTIKAIKTRR